MGADWSRMDVSAQHHLAGCYRRGCLLRLFPEVKAVPCGDCGFAYPGLPGGSLASCRRKDTRRAADASHLGEGTVPLVLGEVPLEWGGSTGVAWVTWIWWRRARVQHAWSWGGRAVAWAILGSGLAIQSPCREGLPSLCWEAPAAGCQACQFCYTVVWLQSSFQKVCGGLGLKPNQSPTSLSGLHKPGVMVHTCSLVHRGRIRSSQQASVT